MLKCYVVMFLGGEGRSVEFSCQKIQASRNSVGLALLVNDKAMNEILPLTVHLLKTGKENLSSPNGSTKITIAKVYTKN